MQDIQAQPTRERKVKELAPDLLVPRAPLQFGSSKLPKSLADAFNKFASAERPLFRIPSKILLREVPREDLEMAWRNDLLRGMPIGLKSTFAHEDKDQWLHLAMKDTDRDVALSPLEPEMTSELLLAILRFQTFRTKISCYHVRLTAKSTWNCGNRVVDWQACAEETPGVRIHRERGARGYKSASIALQRARSVKPLDFEGFAFSFLERVDGVEFYSTPSLAESMFHYGQNPEHATVPLDVCYDLVWRARQSGFAQPSKRRTLIVKLDKHGVQAANQHGVQDERDVVLASKPKSSSAWRNSCEGVEDEMEFGRFCVQRLLLSEAGQSVFFPNSLLLGFSLPKKGIGHSQLFGVTCQTSNIIVCAGIIFVFSFFKPLQTSHATLILCGSWRSATFSILA